MRFERLDLLRYGGFQDTTLTFPKGARDLHVIYGPNEAGKSTTLCAIRDFLFGFPRHILGGNWMTAASLLRVGACLEQDGTVFEGVRRRPTRNQTLFAADDRTPLDDLQLRTWLGGLDAKGFEAAWALDHARLRKGGDDMHRLKDDAGLQILAAGLGLEGVGKLAATLQDDVNSEWKYRSSKSGLQQARTKLTELQKTLRNDTTTARQLSISNKELSQSETEKTLCEREIQDLGVRRRNNSRRKMTSVPFQKLTDIETEIAQLSAWELSIQDCVRIEKILETLRRDEHAASIARQKIDAISEQIKSFGEPDPILVDHENIRPLLAKGVLIDRLEAAAGERQARMTRDGIWLEQFWARHGCDPGDLPALIALDDLDQRLQARVLLQTQEQDLRARLRDTKQALDGLHPVAGSGTEEHSGVERLRLFRLELDEARSLGPVDERIDGLAQDVARQEDLTAAAYGTLLPWSAKIEGRRGELTGLAVPDTAGLEDEIRLWAALEEQRRTALDEEQAAQTAAAQLAQQRRRLEEDGHAVSREQLLAARQERDRLWQGMEGHFQSGTCPAPAMREAFGILIQNADSLADRRHAHAEQSALLATLVRQGEDLVLRADEARRRVVQAEAELERRRIAWAAQLEALGAPVLPPAQLQVWIGRRQTALAAEDALQALRMQLESTKASRDEMSRRLGVFIKGCTSDRLAVQIRQAASLLERDEAEAQHHAAQQAERVRLEKALTRDRAMLSELERSQAQWEEDWAAACHGCRYPGRAERVDLQDVREARTIQERLENEQKEQDSEAHDIAAFRNALGVFLQRYGQRDAVELEAFLTRELERERERQAVVQQRNAVEAEIAQADVQISAFQAELMPVRSILGIGPDDDLHATLSQARHRAVLCEKRDELREQIRQAGNGRPLEALLEEARGTDPAQLEQEFEAIEAETEALNARRSEVDERLFKARAALAELETARGVHETAEEIQETEAEIAERASRYVSLRLQQLMLSRLVEQGRQKAHGPLLSRAGDLFSRLTLRRYAGLATEDEGSDGLVLAGSRPGNTALVPVHAMSEGTRDQLYLALRLASVEQALDRGIRLPFLADDLFVTFDEERTAAGLKILAEISEKTQVLFFTHHGYILNQSKDIACLTEL